MSAQELKSVREAAALTQGDMANLMGLGQSAYQDVEGGRSPFKPRHQQALERVSLRLAVERGDLNLALPSIRRDALDFARLFNGEIANLPRGVIVAMSREAPIEI